MSLSGNFIYFNNTRIGDSYDIGVYLGIIIVFLFLISVYAAYEYILAAQRETILASLKIKSRAVTLPFIGEVVFYGEFDDGSLSFISAKWILRLMQLGIVAMTTLNVYTYIFNMISGMLNGNSYAEFDNEYIIFLIKIAIIMEVAIMLISIPMNCAVTDVIVGNNIVGILSTVCPLIGYLIIEIIILKYNLIDNDGYIENAKSK